MSERDFAWLKGHIHAARDDVAQWPAWKRNGSTVGGHPPMSSEGDIVERLRAQMKDATRLIYIDNKLWDEAADEIESLRKERDEAKAACRAMVREIERLKAQTDDYVIHRAAELVRNIIPDNKLTTF